MLYGMCANFRNQRPGRSIDLAFTYGSGWAFDPFKRKGIQEGHSGPQDNELNILLEHLAPMIYDAYECNI